MLSDFLLRSPVRSAGPSPCCWMPTDRCSADFWSPSDRWGADHPYGPPEPGSRSTFRCLTRNLCVFTSCEGISDWLLPGDRLALEGLSAFAERAERIVVSAYDGEGLVIWTPR